MSYAHVRLIQINQNQHQIEYQVESFDFNSEKLWEKVGKLLINLTQNDYLFFPEPIWESQQIYPPSIFKLEQALREKVLQSQYQNYGGEAWSMQIDHWATSFLRRQSFPQYYPAIFFPEKSQFNLETELNLAR